MIELVRKSSQMPVYQVRLYIIAKSILVSKFREFLFLTTSRCFLLFISKVLRMRPIEQTKVHDETRNASNTEKSNLAESTVTKMKIDGPKDPFAKHSTGMLISFKCKGLEGNRISGAIEFYFIICLI